MSFLGYFFIFDDTPCEEFNTMMYDFGSSKDDGGILTSSGKIIEDRIARRYDSLFYNEEPPNPLEFTFTFGANVHEMEKNRPLDRWDMEAISKWLTNKGGYRWLEIVQPDLDVVRYRCIITELKYISVGWSPWAFSCKVTCDSGYAYTATESFLYNVSGTKKVPFYNRASCKYYMPPMKLSLTSGNSFSIMNLSDNNHKFSLTGIPSASGLVINVDNNNGIITNNRDLNLYQYCNFDFFRLISGDNSLEFQGYGDIEFVCEFPVSVGG